MSSGVPRSRRSLGDSSVNTIFGGEGADVLNGGTGGDDLYGDAGKDTITVGTVGDTDVDKVHFTETTEFGGGDTILGFRSDGANKDKVVFSGTLNAAYDYSAKRRFFTFFTSDGVRSSNETVDIDSYEALLLTGTNDGLTDSLLGSVATLAAELNSEFNFTNFTIGDDLLIVVNGSTPSVTSSPSGTSSEYGASADVVAAS